MSFARCCSSPQNRMSYCSTNKAPVNLFTHSLLGSGWGEQFSNEFHDKTMVALIHIYKTFIAMVFYTQYGNNGFNTIIAGHQKILTRNYLHQQRQCSLMNQFAIICQSVEIPKLVWWHSTGSTLSKVMACCLMTPSHYLNQWWLFISKAPLLSSEGIVIWRSEDTDQ